jgi:hypothetical protein
MVSGPGPGPGAARSKAYMERRNIDATLSGHKWNMDRGRGGGAGARYNKYSLCMFKHFHHMQQVQVRLMHFVNIPAGTTSIAYAYLKHSIRYIMECVTYV